MEFGEISMAMD